ncbi:hypothetical protein Poli38472_007936 [Pythium oligandrum]|uniref:Uncharacterized protein n=1 Tax=Pythium oligandrum TaxID=41045 RepID=A0A8K1FLI5_PYTOL|nr:hypothetical protein Poli38472_007936 [Pythium oligandrum]|eukprot:TMW65294.1 hypothetical protein Poli38472_007936 [Pythium oligandrum]
MVPLSVLAGVLLLAFSVGVLGIARITKERPSYKRYESDIVADHGDMGSHTVARMMETEIETTAQKFSPSLRARRERDAADQVGPRHGITDLFMRMARLIVQFSGIPLLSANTTDDGSMGNSKLTRQAGRHEDPEVMMNAKQMVLEESQNQIVTSEDVDPLNSDMDDQDTESDEDMVTEEEENQSTEEPIGSRPAMLMDGLVFYNIVNQVAAATASNALEIGLTQAVAIVINNRLDEKAQHTILAIEARYPDITCLSSTNFHINSVIAPASHMTKQPLERPDAAKPLLSTQLETSFLSAA